MGTVQPTRQGLSLTHTHFIGDKTYLCQMKKRQVYSLLFLAIAIILVLNYKDDEKAYIYNEGLIFGTNYHSTYETSKDSDYNLELREHLMDVVDHSLSTFNKTSIISKINLNEAHQTDSAFERVFLKAQAISKLTDGAFDITVAPLVNRWGFGYHPEKDSLPSEKEIADLLKIVGFQKIRLENHQLIKQDSQILLDASAIAKGYAVDVAADFLDQKGIENYMVEIGGEIRVKGLNPNGQKWRLGIDKPIDDVKVSNRELDTIIHLTDMALATSGNYRQFYYKDGKRYSHTINPLSGYPVNHHLLSATVLAPDCMTADALATACMVMGAERSLAIINGLPNIECYLIVDDHGKNQSLYSDHFIDFLKP